MLICWGFKSIKLEDLPVEILIRILREANNRSASRVSRQFYRLYSEAVRQLYHTQSGHYQWIENGSEALKNQELEINTLLEHEPAILNITNNLNEIVLLFDRLKALMKIQSNSFLIFMVKEKVLEDMNVLIIQTKMNQVPAGEQPSLDCSDCHLTRFPGKVITENMVYFRNLITLAISINQLQRLPGEIQFLTQLTSLFIFQNKIEKLPPEIGQLAMLQTLSASNNLLKKLPSEIGRLSRLEWLSVRANNLEELPAEIGQLSALKELDLDENSLQKLPASIGNLLKLEALSLQYNYLSMLPLQIRKLAALRELFVNHNYLEDLPTLNEGVSYCDDSGKISKAQVHTSQERKKEIDKRNYNT